MLGLLVIFGDTVYFLIVASYGGEQLLWLASFFFLYMLAEALVFYSTVEVVGDRGGERGILRRAAVWRAGAGADGGGGGRAGLRVRGQQAPANGARSKRCEREAGGRGEGRGKGAARPSACASPAISTMARCRASSACRCAWRSCAR